MVGQLSDLELSEILQAEEVVDSYGDGDTNPKGTVLDYGTETWTFYRIATNKGSVTIRWCGSSNGYYSERVHLKLVKGKHDL